MQQPSRERTAGPSKPVVIEPFFMDGAAGPLMAVLSRPEDRGEIREAVLHVPAFGEEMNKSRRMVASAARALAARGVATLVVDLFGCGDSSGDFSDATLDIWLDDLESCFALLAADGVPVSVWGLRMGGLIANRLIGLRSLPAARLVLWQSMTKGENGINEFLRLKVAAEMFSADDARPAPNAAAKPASTKAIRAQLAAGDNVEVAGYELTGALTGQLDGLQLDPTAPPDCPVLWSEVIREAGRLLLPDSRRVVDAWRGADGQVCAEGVVGEPFWRTLEIAHCQPLVDLTVDYFDVHGSGADTFAAVGRQMEDGH